ncbi:agouti-related protein-like [Centroberyx affinis]|uniref:agouti-related protein-like n=1 Tax=Centroberyx affinis TaxID=166261 RepID=UPI003A5BFE4D
MEKRAIAHKELPPNPSRDQAPRSAEPLIQGRQRTLFARRGVYERQRVHAPKPKVLPAPPNGPPPKAAPKPVSPRCSRLSESCLPQSRCCDPCATCHCRFFNTICFCRKTNSLCQKKT